MPVTPSSTTWRHPRMSVATTGRPIAAASIAERGNPSRYDAEHVEVHRRVELVDVVPHPEERDAGVARPRSRSAVVIASSFSASIGPTTTTLDVAARASRSAAAAAKTSR